MNAMDCSTRQPESLGAFLARVRPGDTCTCCGAVLQSRYTDPRHPASGRAIAGTVDAMVCLECGCEICEEESDADKNLRELSPAA